jgi:fibronectin type 3 domain-containing protein
VRAQLFQPRIQEEPDEPHSVTITWVAGKTPVAGYNVYREFQYGGPVKLTAQIIPGTQYTDTTVKRGRTYSYYVTSVDSKGTESVPSERITVTVPIAAATAAK